VSDKKTFSSAAKSVKRGAHGITNLYPNHSVCYKHV
jgi:hypothetical protein